MYCQRILNTFFSVVIFHQNTISVSLILAKMAGPARRLTEDLNAAVGQSTEDPHVKVSSRS